jgi:hypothetical protein
MSSSSSGADDAGAGVVSTLVGTAIFLLFLMFAAQLLLGLYLTSVVNAVTYDAAKTAAGASVVHDGGGGGRARVEAAARRQMGRFGPAAEFTWTVDDDAVRLTVRVARPPVLPGLLPAVRSPIERTARVRVERVR